MDRFLPHTVQVIAREADGRVKAVWPAAPLAAAGGCHLIAARWLRGERRAGPLRFVPGDVLVERYDEAEWFNVFAVWDPGRRRLRGFYVNLSTPVHAEIRAGAPVLTYTDLGVDLVVTRSEVVELDTQDWEAAVSGLGEGQRRAAHDALAGLRERLLGAGPDAAWQWLCRRVQACGCGPGAEFLAEAAGRWGVPLVYRGEVDFWAPEELDHWLSLYERGERVAEAIYVLRLPGGRTLLHTKAFYPEGAFRLPGGGIPRGEAPWDAAVREAAEETGLETRPAALLGYADVELRAPSGMRVRMPNYVFLLDPVDPEATPVPAADERISGFRMIPWEELADTADALLRLEGAWREWGRYRAIGHELAYRAIREGRAWS